MGCPVSSDAAEYLPEEETPKGDKWPLTLRAPATSSTLPVPTHDQVMPVRCDISVLLDYAAQAPCTVLMQIAAHDGDGQTLHSTTIDLGTHSNHRDVTGDARIGTRTWLDVTNQLHVTYQARAEVTRRLPDWDTLRTSPLRDLPPDVVTYLMSSRYCPADAFLDFLPTTFGHLSGGPMIRAMANWITQNLTYDIYASNWQTTALDTFDTRRGVCRDYAHLLIAMARSSAIPARMVSAYGPDVDPPDFHAVVEVWLDGAWHLIDPTGMATADRLIKIGVGRDAADVAFLTAFGVLSLNAQSVSVTTTP